MDNNFFETNDTNRSQSNEENQFSSTNSTYYYNPNAGVGNTPPPPERKGYATTSLITGLASILCCSCTFLAFACAIAAIVFAIAARKQNGFFQPLATAGLILGIIGFILTLVLFVLSFLLLDTLSGLSPKALEEFFKQFETLE